MHPFPLTDPLEAAEALRQELLASQCTVVLTGAGISTDSGIPDFRSPGGIWSKMEPIEFDAFCQSEDARLEDWRRRFEMVALFQQSAPNGAHRAIAHAARSGPVDKVITQNIDGLHKRADTPADKLIEIHGTCEHAKCLACGAPSTIEEAQRAIDETGASPRCSKCGGLVKTAIVSFGEAMPEQETIAAQTAAASCDLFIAAGTSLVVYPAASLPIIAKESGARVVIASREETEQDQFADLVIRSSLAQTFSPLEQIKFD